MNPPTMWLYLLLSLTETLALSLIAPEIPPSRISTVSNLISTAFGDNNNAIADRYMEARKEALSHDNNKIPPHELVYGELSVQVLATILDAVGVQDGDVFLDIGSGDGALVLGASLLYARENANAIRKSVGLEILPGLVNRSIKHTSNLEKILQGSTDNTIDCLLKNKSQVQFLLGDIHNSESETISNVLAEITLAVCFATTWSAGNAKEGSTSLNGRKLPKLSKALSKLSKGTRVIIIDGALDESDGFCWQGNLRVNCPDTAPYSVASLYLRT